MFQHLRALLPLVALALAGGCGLSREASEPPRATAEPKQDSAALPDNAFTFDEKAGVIFLDARVPPGQRRRFDIGQGSITLETLHVQDDNLTFHFTPETEGGYVVYECTVPISPDPISFQINPDGTPGATSFDLSQCKMIRSGNLLLEP